LPKFEKYQKTIESQVSIKGLSVHNEIPTTVLLKPSFSGTGKYFSFSNFKQPIFEEDGNNSNPLKNSKSLESLFRNNLGNKEINTKFINNFAISRSFGFNDSYSKYRDNLTTFNQTKLTNNSKSNPNSTPKNHVINAQIENVTHKPNYYIKLNQNSYEVHFVDHLLSTLEALSIDNIEIVLIDNNHIPSLDGSSAGWISKILEAKTIYSKNEHTLFKNEKYYKRRKKIRLNTEKFISINHNDSFISIYPSPTCKITVGIDYSKEVPIIGKQWFSYNLYEDDHYR